jgi:hydrogenase-4 component B
MDASSMKAGVMLLPVAWYGVALVVVIARALLGKTPLRWLPSAFIMAGGVTGAIVAVWALLTEQTLSLNGWMVAPFAQVGFRLDPLAAWFLLVISVSAVASAWYGVGYLTLHGDNQDEHSIPARERIDGHVAVFLASMSLLVLADSIFGFLFFWEIMSLVSFFLVIGDGHSYLNRRSAFIYAVMTHAGTGALIVAFLLLTRHAHSFHFATIAGTAATLGQSQRAIIFLLALLGFGTKAGLIPLHVWLPRAHPAAPSHVSALMSGVMVKTALYGLLRVAIELAGPPAPWWGALLILGGGVSAVLGVLYALMERNLKRILAYSTVEHIGILTMGTGATLYLDGRGHSSLAALALIATLTHLLNHSLFKGLLFLGAGAIQAGSGVRDLERLGGLIHRMPRTSILMLIGCMSIAAVPPLNGFAGEWLLFQALLNLGAASTHVRGGILAGSAAAMLALTSALAIACFVRVFGIGFLAQPQSEEAKGAREVPASMIGGMGLLASGCVLLGLVPNLLLHLLRPVSEQLVGARAQPSLSVTPALTQTPGQGAYSPLMIAAGLALLGVVPWLVARVSAGPLRQRRAPTWVCGVGLEPSMQYSATAFAKPIRLIFQAVTRPQRTVQIERSPSQFVVSAIRYEERLTAVYEQHLYERVTRWLVALSYRARQLQSGSLRLYLTYLLLTLILILLIAR